MEISRRNFIKFVVGGVAGVHITPLPWKLTDDIAIWTQNWPWVPVPPTGEFIHEKSICTLCPGACGIEVRKVDKRAVKIEGRTDFPINPGGICPVGMGGLQLVYDEDLRFTGPMKRVGPRGSGDFVNISWEEALNLLAERINSLRLKGRPELLAAVDGNRAGTTISALISRLMRAIGSPNYMRIPSVEDTYWMLNAVMHGNEGPIGFDLENSDYILSFGCGLLEGWGAPGRVLNSWGVWHGQEKGKVKIVQIESRLSNTASKADKWIAARPGTEAALALGIAHVIIKEGLYDKDFITNFSFGFHELRSSVDGKTQRGFKTFVMEKYSPAQVEKITGVKATEITKLAREFAKAKAPIAIFGRGKGILNGSLFEFMAIHSLNGLVGNINKPGGVLIHQPLPLKSLPDFDPDPVAESGLTKPRVDGAGTKRFPWTNSLINNFSEAIINAEKPLIDSLMIFASNPAFTLPDGGKFRRALKKIPFIISFSPFRDDTALMADLILPDHTYLEKIEDVVWPVGLQYPFYGISAPVLEPIYDTKNTGDVILELAKVLEEPVVSAFPWDSFEDVLKLRAQGLFKAGNGAVTYDGSEPVWKMQKQGRKPNKEYSSFEEMWEKLKSEGMWYQTSHSFKNWSNLFKTFTNKFEFYCTEIETKVYEYSQEVKDSSKALQEIGVQARNDEIYMPHYEDLDHQGPHELKMVPYEIINLSSSWIPSPPFLSKTWFDNQLRKNESFAEINPDTAAKYGLKEGDRIIIESPAGNAKVRVTLFEGAMPGYVYLPLGFGHWGFDEFLQNKGINPNHLVADIKDPLTGLPVWWMTPVKIKKTV